MKPPYRIFLDKPAPAPATASVAGPTIERAPLPSVEVQGGAHLVTYVNPAFCRLIGKPREELVGHPFAELVPGGSACVPILDRVYLTGETITHEQEIEDPHRARWIFAMWPTLDTQARPVGVIIQLASVANSPLSAAVNEALLIAGLRQHELTAEAMKLNGQLENEIAERKVMEAELHAANERLASQASQLEQLVAQRTKTLRETVSELEAFSYSVAHDMRSPLRGMQGFARILLEEHREQLDPQARDYLDRIASSAARMDLLIQEVLNYTWVLRGEAILTPVDLDRLVREIIAVYPAWQPPKTEIQIEGKLPWVMGHEGLLTQCVSNLLSNAVKFVAPGVTPRVRIWAAEPPPSPPGAVEARNPEGRAEGGDGPVVRIWFGNNGIGIAEKDHRRVFRMFERINPANQFEGTGIGLTIVRKAVERMGGRIDFESEEEKGSRFWIELKTAVRPAAAR